jgi:hypothetical protein
MGSGWELGLIGRPLVRYGNILWSRWYFTDLHI